LFSYCADRQTGHTHGQTQTKTTPCEYTQKRSDSDSKTILILVRLHPALVRTVYKWVLGSH